MIVGQGLQVRPAVPSDVHQIAGLLQTSSQVHRHMDWCSPLDWIGSPPFFVVENQGQVFAALGCSPDPPQVAWVRLFANSGKIPVKESWQMLWDSTKANLAQRGQFITAAIVLQEWLRDMLISSGFTKHQLIILLERNDENPPTPNLPTDISLRRIKPADLPAVAEVDFSAFELIWRNSLPVLEKAYPQAEWATLAEMDGQVIGYQLSTRNSLGLHLARLAVRPELQGKGIGSALVSDLIQQAARAGIPHLTVNTQSDNAASLALYQRLGFHENGERYPVYQLCIPSGG